MSDVTDNLNLPPDPPVTDQSVQDRVSFTARVSKALAGGVTGLVSAIGAGLTTALADGSISQSDAWTIAGLAVGGFVIGFAGVYAAPPNKK